MVSAWDMHLLSLERGQEGLLFRSALLRNGRQRRAWTW